MRPSLLAISMAALSAALPSPLSAHGIVGNRFFPATITTDDPFVADELSLPTVSTIRTPANDTDTTTRDTEISGEISKRVTPDFGVSINGAFLHHVPDEAKPTSNFENLGLGAKYQVFKNAPHEAIASLGIDVEVGGTGATRVGADQFTTITPGVFFGKGLGDLPNSLPWLRPFAMTGSLGLAFPTQPGTNTYSIDPDTGASQVDTERHPHVLQYSFAVEYSLQYLQSFVRDTGLGAPFDRLIPLVEVQFEAPLDRGQAGRTTGTINPGFIWAGQQMQFGVEAILPATDRTSQGVGVRAQLHFYLDDIFPGTIGRPIFGDGR